MDGFTYTNIFDTKGIEYLVIIAFLLLLIPFWIRLNKESKIVKQIYKTLDVLSANILKIPKGIFFSKNHTWSHLEKSGEAKVGLDDFLVKTVGDIQIKNLKNQGDIISKGELITEINQNDKKLNIFSPISGEIMQANPILVENSEIINEDPYEKGWIYNIKPSNWVDDTKSYYLADEAIVWSNKELERLKDFISVSIGNSSTENSPVLLQDGGELRINPLSDLKNEIWKDFQKEFLT
ncbi:MAG: glycine cleavage system protein H [Saprospiraceae bacterium]|nr:glycine cleavage system protein H [Saprospiraceae bacterium]